MSLNYLCSSGAAYCLPQLYSEALVASQVCVCVCVCVFGFSLSLSLFQSPPPHSPPSLSPDLIASQVRGSPSPSLRRHPFPTPLLPLSLSLARSLSHSLFLSLSLSLDRSFSHTLSLIASQVCAFNPVEELAVTAVGLGVEYCSMTHAAKVTSRVKLYGN